MLPLTGLDHIDLSASGIQSSHRAPDAEQDEFGDIAEVEADAATVRTAILPPLRPDDVAHVTETPGLHNPKALGQESIGHPQIQMSVCSSCVCYGHRTNLGEGHRVVTIKSAMLWRYLACSVLEGPRGVCQ